MARNSTIKVLRTTRAALNAAAAASQLLEGELYYITDERRLAVGAGTGGYRDFEKTTERSTWTPVLTINGVTTGIVHSVQEGTYTRIGNMVFLRCGNLVISNKGAATGAILVTGMPFPTLDQARGVARLSSFTGLSGGLVAELGSTGVSLLAHDTTGVFGLSNTNLTNSSSIRFDIAYHTNSPPL